MKLWNFLGVFGLVGSFLPSMSKTTTLHQPTTIYQTTTTARPTPEFNFPVKSETCPPNFPAEILYNYNLLRNRFNFTDLTLTSELNQAAERISYRTQRCYENCRPLNRKFPAVGQDFYTKDGGIKKTQFKLTVLSIVSKILQFQKKGMPYYFQQRSRQFIEYSEEEWGKIKEMGVACATYVVSGRKGTKWKTVNRLKITFTFEKPKLDYL